MGPLCPHAGFEEAEPQGLMGGTMPTVAEPQEAPAHDTTASSFLDLSGLEMLEAKELMSSDPAAPPAAQVLEEGGLVPYGPGKVGPAIHHLIQRSLVYSRLSNS